jgi:transposase
LAIAGKRWERIRKHFPEEHIADDRPGRKPVPTRRVLEAVLWILNTGAQCRAIRTSPPVEELDACFVVQKWGA